MIGGKAHVLIVEDSLAMMYALRTQFEACGWEVSLARTVGLALEQLEPAPDWIVLDLWHSDGGNEDVLDHVRQAGIPSRVAVISARLDAERLAALKPDLVLQKPISFAALFEACRGGVAPLASRGMHPESRK